MSPSNENLSNNILDEDFLKMLKPFYLTQKLLCISKYSLKDSFVLPNSKAYRVLNILVPSFVTYAYISISSQIPCTLENQCPLIVNMHNLLGFLISTACTTFQTKSAVALLIRMQGIDRKLKSLGVTNLTYFVVNNWCYNALILIFYGSATLFLNLKIDHISWLVCVTVLSLIVADLDILCATFIIEFLCSRLKVFLSFFTVHNENLLQVSVENNTSVKFKNVVTVTKEILQFFAEACSLIQYWVLGKFVSIFIDSAFTVQIAITLTNIAERQVPVAYVFLGTWYIKNLATVIMFSLTCEKFYSRVDDTKRVCAAILELHPEQSIYKKVAKNMLRLCDVRHSKMRVCGLFAVDAALPLRLAGIVATYSIVLLQFAFLK